MGELKDLVSNGLTPLHVAVIGDSKKEEEHLIAQNDKVGEVDENSGVDAVRELLESGVDAVRELLESGDVDVRDTDSGGRTALHYAVAAGKLEITKLLLAHDGIIADFKDENGWTPLHHALFQPSDRKEIIKLLLDHPGGGGVTAADNKERTPMHVAVIYNKLEEMKLIHAKLEHEGNIARNNAGDTALHIAIKNYNINVIKQFIEFDQDELYSAPDIKGNTPLFYLIQQFPGLVKSILDKKIRLEQGKPDVDSSDLTFKVHVDFTTLTTVKFDLMSIIKLGGHIQEQLVAGVKNTMPFYTRVDAEDVRIYGDGQKGKGLNKLVPNAFEEYRYNPMRDMAENMKIQLLVHPVVEQFLMKKWWGYGRFYYMIMVLFYLIYLGSLIVYELTAIRPQVLVNGTWYFSHMENSSYRCEDFPSDHGCMTEKASYCINAGFIVLGMAVWKLMWEFVEMLLSVCGAQASYTYSNRKGYRKYLGLAGYFIDPENLLQIFLYSTSIYFVSDVLNTWSVMGSWKWMVGIFSIMAGCLEILSVLRLMKFGNIGQQIIMFYRIAQTFVTGILFLLVFCIAAFILFFQMIFSQYGDYGSLDLTTIYRIIVRWTSGGSADEFKETAYGWEHWVSFLCLLLSIVLVEIICMNLATGLAFEDVGKVKKEAVAERNALRILHVYKFAGFHEMITKPLRYCLQCCFQIDKENPYHLLTSHLESKEDLKALDKEDLSDEKYDIADFVIFDEFDVDKITG